MVSIRTVLDILTCLISLVGVAPLYVYLDRLPQLAFPVALVAAFFMGKKSLRPLAGRFPTVLSIGFFLFYAVRISRDNILDPTINILVILLAVRLLSERIPRNYLQAFALSLFALSASSLYDLSPLFLVYLLSMLLCIAASLVLLTFYTVDSRLALSRNGMKRLMTVSVAMPAVALPLILLFFVIMPRPQFPLWNFLLPSEEKQTGLSELIDPGASSQVLPVKSPVLRAQSPKLPRKDLYWRGIVLNTPRHDAWVRSPVSEGGYVKSHGAELVRQTILPEPNAGPYLITLDTPVKISGVRANQSSDLVFTRKRSAGRVRYDTVSCLNRNISVSGTLDRDFYLTLPEHVSRRVRDLGKKIAMQGKSDSERVAALEKYYRAARFRYTTTGLPRSQDAIGEFLFQSKAGHCELFATSFMLLLREAGVPARLVGGYYGGDYNDLGGYYLVTEDMAHVWVEVFLKGSGWVRIDPTVYAVGFVAGGNGSKNTIIGTLRKFSDYLNYYWNNAVITYNLDKQIQIFRSANNVMRNFSVQVGSRWLLFAFLGFGGLAAAVRFVVKGGRSTPEERLIRAFRMLVAKKYPDVAISSATGLLELAERTDDPYIKEFAETYYACVYRDSTFSADQLGRLKKILKALEYPEGNVS